MDTYNHYLKTYNEYGKNLQGDLPLALFMIKLLNVEKDYSIFKEQYKFNEYMKSDKPIKLRYYLQVDFWNELDDILKEVQTFIKNEINHLNKLFGYVERKDICSLNTYYHCTKIPENRQELYDKYLLDIVNLDYTKQQRDDKITIEDWLNDVDTIRNNGVSKELRCDVVLSRIKGVINLRYPIDTFKKDLRKIINFRDKESVDKLLYSMRDVYILGLV